MDKTEAKETPFKANHFLSVSVPVAVNSQNAIVFGTRLEKRVRLGPAGKSWPTTHLTPE